MWMIVPGTNLESVICDNLPDSSALEKWIRSGKPIGRAVRDIKAGETFTINVHTLLAYASAGIPEEMPLG